ncbi:MAG: C-terminal binding protein [Anaerolineaceae bacterium]|nr:C-terminal binding protein [Anaerolineaceae bacterium]
MPTRIVVTDYLEPDFQWETEQLRSRGFDFQWDQQQLKFAEQAELIEAISEAEIVVVNMARLTAEVISRLDNCKLIIRHGIGYDNVDLAAATAKGIRLANVPDYCVQEVAEQSVMLIVAAARHLCEQQNSLARSVRKGQWDFSVVRSVFQMKGKTLGIIGCGRIGSTVLQMVSGFGMNLLVCDPYLTAERKAELGLQTHSFEKVIKESDIITIHTPLNDQTRGAFNAETLAMMKPTAVLVNTARGPLVVDQDLARALHKGTIMGAAIDVYDLEPPGRDNPLLGAPNCLLTPHLSWYSEESGWSIREKILEDIIRYFEGRPPRFTVNTEVEEVLKKRGA